MTWPKLCPKTNHASRVVVFLSLLLSLIIAAPQALQAQTQTNGSVHGQVLDPTGAEVPGAALTLAGGGKALNTQSGKDGAYSFKAIAPGSYSLTVDAAGFATFSKTNIAVHAGQAWNLDVPLAIAVQQQNVAVSGHVPGVSVNPDENASAMVISGADIDALSDDPTELQNELQALAGPAAGPNGGEIYIDGFTGGQLPPKSSIREIRINQNPFSAEFDKIGYGRIEILTKPGSDKFSGHIRGGGVDSALDTANPLIPEHPSYHAYFAGGDVNGPLTKQASYFFNFFSLSLQNQSIIDAVNPQDTTASVKEAVPNPSSITVINPRIDFQLGKSNTVSVRDNYFRSTQTGAGVGTLNLPQQAFNSNSQENAVQATDTVVVSSRLLNETHFQWRRVRNSQFASYFTPTVTVQGSFTDGGNSSGVAEDHQDIYELQNYSTATAGKHTLRFGARLRAYQDANYSTAGVNGTYSFESIPQYLAKTPSLYSATVIKTPLARALLFDAALFYQDDWRWKLNLTLSYGLRFESQNRIQDHADWAPRLALAWAPGHLGKAPSKTQSKTSAKAPPKTVIRAGYGWFYDRFTVPTSFNSASGTPYVIQAIHQNGINQQSYVIQNPDFFNPAAAVPPSSLKSEAASIPYSYSVDRHFHAALNMQGGVGVDQQIGKAVTFNVTYLYTRGVHQYLTNNVTAPEFDPATYAVIGPLPAVYNYQFQSGGYFTEHQIITTANTRIRHLSLHASYTYSEAKSDTQGVTYFPSDSRRPGLDYGRSAFGIHHRFLLIGTYAAPYGITIAPIIVAQSGTPYNLTIGSDLTGTNQFNARPTYGTCGAAAVVSTPYGCLDTNPVGKGEKIIPYGVGTGPANTDVLLRVSKVIGIGPKIKTEKGAGGMGGGGNGSVNGRGLSGSQTQMKFDATVKRRYSLTVGAAAVNVFNIVNLAPQNGTLLSPLFGKSQSLASGPFGVPVPGNRVIFIDATFSF